MNSNDINESELFEENNLYIIGNDMKASIKNIREDFDLIGKELFSDTSNNDNNNEQNISIDYNDIIIKKLESEIEDIINTSSAQLLNNKKKKMFVLNKQSDYTSKSNEKKGNYLRNEAKILEETIKPLQLPSYQTIKTNKYHQCPLNSYHFFKSFCKKEVGKENNYIFNYRDNYLNDMTKIDTLFFLDYFKPDPMSNKGDELVFEFSIYHPTKNVKTQQIAVLGSEKLIDLKDKIYCVLDEIQSGELPSFFFIENAFYNDLRQKKQVLSLNISENKINKLTMKDFQLSDNNNNKQSVISKEKSKFNYNEKIYCNKRIINDCRIYEDLSMEAYSLNEIVMRIGYPYLFRHIESCDHMIILNDVRLRDQYDNFNKDNCVVTYQKKIKRRKCDACLFYYAKFISINDSICQETSHALFLCDYCLNQLHEEELKENKTNNLKLIPYFHD